MARGDKYAAQQKYAEAIIEYRNALKKDPKDGTARARLAESYAFSNDPKNAAHETILAADLLPDNMDAQVRAGQYQLLAGKYDEARARADRVLAKDPLNVTAQLLRGNATAGLKDFATAIEEINQAMQIDPSDIRSYTSLGAIALSQGRRKDAEDAFKQAMDIQPSSGAVHLALANFYWSSGRVREVEPLLVRAVRLEPRNVTAQRALATYYLATGRPDSAEAPLKGIVEAIQDIPSRLALADYYIATRRPAEARTVLNIVADYPKGFGAGMIRLAALDYSEKRPEAAHQKLQTVLAKQPKNADALLLKAQFLTREQKFDEAGAEIRAAVGADPHSVAAQHALGTFSAARGHLDTGITAFAEVLRLNPKSMGARIQLGQLQIRKGAPADALKLAGDVLRDSPAHAGARMLRARALFASGDLNGSQTLLRELAKEYPKAAAVRTELGIVSAARKDPSAARREFEQALALDPSSIGALGGTIALDIQEKKTAGATARLEQRLKNVPNNPDALLLAATTYAAVGDMAQHEEMLRRTLTVDPGNLRALIALATLHAQQNKLDEAKAEFEAISQRAPSMTGAQTVVGAILQAQQKPEEAKKLYQKVLAADPNAALAANNLAWLYAERGEQLDLALQYAQTAKQKLPDLPAVNDTLGWIYYKKNQAARAIAPLELSVIKDPKNPTYRYHLGMAYAKLGNKPKALEALNEALRQKPDFREAEDARKALVPQS